MKANLQFDFIVDETKNTLTIKREFAAERQLVWDCYTKKELLEQWFAPAPLTAKTKVMDFRNGGYWLYAMVEPNGTEHWGKTSFVTIQPIDYYTSSDGFCDGNGIINTALPSANWRVSFSDINSNTLVESVITYDSLEDLKTIVNMGMEAGMKAVLELLDTLLAKLNTKN